MSYKHEFFFTQAGRTQGQESHLGGQTELTPGSIYYTQAVHYIVTKICKVKGITLPQFPKLLPDLKTYVTCSTFSDQEREREGCMVTAKIPWTAG
jgi:hypothetical protein